jgi:hypothetical protein
VAKTLRRVEVLKSLNLLQLQQLCDMLTDVEFGPGEWVMPAVYHGALAVLLAWSCLFASSATAAGVFFCPSGRCADVVRAPRWAPRTRN